MVLAVKPQGFSMFWRSWLLRFSFFVPRVRNEKRTSVAGPIVPEPPPRNRGRQARRMAQCEQSGSFRERHACGFQGVFAAAFGQPACLLGPTSEFADLALGEAHVGGNLAGPG